MSFVTLHTGLSGLQAAQAGVDITSHNISNSGTEGYTRQRVIQRARIPYQSPVGPVGTGVEVLDIVRLRDMFLDNRVRDAVASFAQYDTRASVLERLEVVFAEPDDGITPQLNDLWAAFEDLALDPTNPANRSVTIANLENTAGRIRDVAGGIQGLLDDTVATRTELVSEAQDLLNQVATINREVANAPSDQISNELLDQRDVYIDRLASLAGAKSTLQPDGTYTVMIGSQVAVAGPTASTLSMVGDDLQVNGVSVPYGDHGGELAGIQQLIAVDIPTVQADLEDFVSGLADALNATHAGGFTDAGAAGGPLVTYTPGQAAATLTVAISNVSELALRGTATSGALDATNAVALADLRITARPDGRTHDDAIRETVVALGSAIASAVRGADSSAEIATTAEVNRTSVHGVSLDEEMVSLIQYQRALEAASRVMTAADEMLDTIVNRLGLVGR